MTNSTWQHDFAERLAMQERRISEERIAENRRAVERKVARIAQREDRMRRIILGLGALLAVGMLTFWAALQAFPGHNSLAPVLERIPDIVGAIVMALIFLVPIGLVLFSFVYLLHYRPQLRRAEQEQLLGTILELECQIAELRRRLPPETGPE